MSTFYVKKDGSGTHTQVQSAIYDAVTGDIVNIGEGTWNENIDFMGKTLTIQGAGKDLTVLQGKLANDVVVCSWYAGEDVLTTTSTNALIRGKSISGTNITAGSKVHQILSATQFKLSSPTTTTGNYSKTAVSVVSGSSTIVLPNVTSVVVGHKVQGVGVDALVTAINATTKTITLSSPTTQGGSNVVLSFRVARSNINITQTTNVSSVPATIAFTQNSNGMIIRDLTAIGFDGNVGQEGAALGFGNSTGSGYLNFLIENCKFTANGDSAVMSGGNTLSDGGVIQNCVFDGKTFVGSEPADVPAFSLFSIPAVIKSVGASSTIELEHTRGVMVGSTMTSTSWTGTGSVTALNGKIATINKSITGSVEDSISVTVTNVAYVFPNVARNFVYIGTNTTPPNNNFKNLTFKNNLIKGQSGAVISATGDKSMFNSAVTIESFGGLVENNEIDGIFGAGQPNTVFANFAIRCRQADIVVRNNVNKVSGGRGNSGFYVALGTSENNITIDRALVSATQAVAGQAVTVEMSKDLVKSISKVSADSVFSLEANWHLVTFIYKKQGSSKRLVASFSSFENEKQMKLRPGMLTGDVFELHKIIISKADRTLMVVKRSEIESASSFDFTLA